MSMCWVAVAWRTCARLVELHCLVWLSASGGTGSQRVRAKTPAELLVPLPLYLGDREMHSRDGQKVLEIIFQWFWQLVPAASEDMKDVPWGV